MPGFDGIGPQGEGPLTGRADGYCAVGRDPEGRPYGVAGIRNRPFVGWFVRLGRTFGRGLGYGRGRRVGIRRGGRRGGRRGW